MLRRPQHAPARAGSSRVMEGAAGRSYHVRRKGSWVLIGRRHATCDEGHGTDALVALCQCLADEVLAAERVMSIADLAQVHDRVEDADDGGRKKRPYTRGPMDNMRQLVRILMSIMPQSQANLTQEGNRSTEGDVRRYLERTLGDEAPQPTWGLPDDRNGCKGWIGYMAQLLSWARELQAQHRKVPAEPVTVDEAGRVAERVPGRSWFANFDNILELELDPRDWELPLKSSQVGTLGLRV
mmetsp:Transcript_26422/g.84612  ORF Transcript_26422/g.84612 Transcript_26422/m.84612 type:complete len:240 (+) Transcript_26422:322-1041(+)